MILIVVLLSSNFCDGQTHSFALHNILSNLNALTTLQRQKNEGIRPNQTENSLNNLPTYGLCLGERYSFEAPPEYTNIQWQINTGNGFVDIVGATSHIYIADKVGSYRYNGKDANGCTISLCDSICIVPGNCATLGDYAFLDNNRNGIQDLGDTPLSGITVLLKDTNNNVLLSTTTDVNGKYLFTGLAAGNYVVQFVAPSGYSPTSQKSSGSNSSNDSDIDSNGTTNTITLSAGETRLDIDAGFQLPCVQDGSISGANIICSGHSTMLSASSGQNYLWNTGATTNSITITSGGTYTVTISKSNGCILLASKIITEDNSLTNLNIQSSTTNKLNCSLTSTTLSTNIIGTNYTWSTGATTPSINVTQGGNYSVTITNANGCSNTSSITILEDKTPPQVSVGSTSTVLKCSPYNNVVLTATGGFSYVWNTGATINSISITNAGTYSVTATGSNGCTAAASITITEDKTLPIASVNPSNATLTCTTPSAVLIANGGGTYLWNTGNTNASITVTSGGTYSVTVTGNNGCTALASSVVTENKGSGIASITTNNSTLTCTTPSAVLTANGTGSYVWSTGATTSSISVTTGGTYYVTVTNSNGCTAVASTTISVNKSKPSVCMNPVSSVLTCTTPQVTLSTTCGGTMYSYAWSNGATTSSTTVNSTGTYWLTVTNNTNGCTASASAVVTEDKAVPAASITPNTNVLTCANPSSTLIASGNGTYVWNTGAITNSINVNQTGIYSVTVTGANGCKGIAQSIVSEDKTPPSVAINASRTTLTCSKPSINVYATGGFSYVWNTGATTSSISITNAGVYSVTATGNNGCTAAASITITEDKILPIANINPSNATLTCTTPNAVLTATGGGTYLWNTGNTNASITVTSSGTYSVTVTGNNGCTAVASCVITENKGGGIASITTSNSTLTCTTPSAVLTANGTGSYVWSTGATTSSISVTTGGTYYVTVTNSNGCTAVASTTISVNKSKPSVCMNPVSSVLTCTTPQVTLSTTCGGTMYSYAWSNGATTSSTTVNSAGTYWLTVTNNTNGCTASASAVVTEDKAVPAASITPNTSVLTCANPSSTLIASGNGTYVWNTGAITNSINVNQTGIYSVTVTGANGCKGIAQSIVSEDKTPPSVAINASRTTLTCSKPSINVYATGGVSYVWNTGTTTSSISVTNAGTYSVTATGNNGCTAAASITITEDKILPIANINPINATLTCTTPSAVLTATGGGTYLWNTGNTNASITVTSGGTYSVTVTSNNGCTAVASSVITENKGGGIASITPSATTLTCTTPSAVLTANGSGSYVWSTGATTNSISVTTGGTYYVTVTNSNGCTAVASTTISVNKSKPSVCMNPVSSVLTCTTPQVTLSTTCGGTMYSYAWSNGGTTSSTTVNSAGTYWLTVTNNTNGCTASASAVVTSDVNIPFAIITSSANILTCNNPNATLTANGNGTYVWNTGATTSSININQGGVYSLTVTGTNGCKKATSITISEDKTLPNVSITTSSTILTCANPSAVLTASGNGTYVWNTGSTNASITINNAGTYSVTVTGANGCTKVASVVIMMNKYAPTASISPVNPFITCSNPTVILTAAGGSSYLWNTGTTTSSLTVSQAGTYTVTVTGGNGCTAVASRNVTANNSTPQITLVANPATLTCSSPSSVITAMGATTYLWSTGATGSSITVANAGVYSVTGTSSNGCTSTANIVINENRIAPQQCLQPNTGVLTCSSPTLSLYASGGGTYKWSTGATSAIITVNQPGTYTVTVTTTGGCTAVGTSIITENKVAPNATITASASAFNCKNDPIILTASGNGTYKWSNGTTGANMIATQAGTYSLTVTGSNGCTKTTSITLTENKIPPVAAVSTSTSTLTCTNPTAVLTASGGGTYKWNTGATSAIITVAQTGTYMVTVTGISGCTAVASAVIGENKTLPSASINPTSATLTCANPSAVLTASGGGAYRWNTAAATNSITVTKAGTYTVTVTGTNGCTAIASSIVTANNTTPQLTLMANPATLTCLNTSSTITAIGADSYQWNTGAVGNKIIVTSGGLYTVTGTATNGCTSSASITINEDKVVPKQCLQPTSGVLTCNAPSINLYASGGGTYKWSTGSTTAIITVTQAGTYTVTVTTSSGCTAVGTSVITEDKILPSASITPSSTVFNCKYDPITLTASGNGTYRWSNGVTSANLIVTQAGIYTLTVTGSNGCTKTATFTLTAPTNCNTASIGDCVFWDKNTNGVQDSGEPGVPNVTMMLIGTATNGVSVNLTTTTDVNGKYRFSSLAAGQYRVKVTLPNGYNFTASNQGTSDALDSDVEPATGTTNLYTLIDGQTNLSVDAGLINNASCPNDVTAPIFTSVPANVTVECNAIPNTTPTLSEDCPSGYSLVQTDVISNQTCLYSYTLTRTWKATDKAGNVRTATQVITVRDTQAPVINGVPADITIQCGSAMPTMPGVTAKDNCSQNVNVTFSEIYYQGTCNVPGYLTPLSAILCQWKATDECGNMSIKSWKITISSTSLQSTGRVTGGDNSIKPQELLPSSPPEGMVKVYPNPSMEGWNIVLNSATNEQVRLMKSMIVTDSKGQVIAVQNDINQAQYYLTLNHAVGIYYVNIIDNTGKHYYTKVMKINY